MDVIVRTESRPTRMQPSFPRGFTVKWSLFLTGKGKKQGLDPDRPVVPWPQVSSLKQILFLPLYIPIFDVATSATFCELDSYHTKRQRRVILNISGPPCSKNRKWLKMSNLNSILPVWPRGWIRFTSPGLGGCPIVPLSRIRLAYFDLVYWPAAPSSLHLYPLYV